MPLATSATLDQPFLSCLETQIPTSGFLSCVPPNHDATSPAFVSTMVEAWQEGKGACSKMNSDLTIASPLAPAALFVASGKTQDATTISTSALWTIRIASVAS